MSSNIKVFCFSLSVVKEEIIEDTSVLPTAKGRVVCWVRGSHDSHDKRFD